MTYLFQFGLIAGGPAGVAKRLIEERVMALDAFGIARNSRVAVFIDGANLYAATKALGSDLDYRKMLSYFNADDSRCVSMRYYTAIVEDQEYSSIRPLIDWLDYNGYKVRTKAAKEFVDSMGRRKVKGNMDIDLTIDVMELSSSVDHIVLFSGDGDFKPLVEAVQRKGVRVTVVSTIQTQPAMVADELRRAADHFTDLSGVLDIIGKNPNERQERRPPARGESAQREEMDDRQDLPAFLQTPAAPRQEAVDQGRGDDRPESAPNRSSRGSTGSRSPRTAPSRSYRS